MIRISPKFWITLSPIIYALIDNVCLNSKPYNDLDQVRDHIQSTYFDREDTFDFIVGIVLANFQKKYIFNSNMQYNVAIISL